MGEAEISGPLVPYDYSSEEEEEEIPPLKEELKGDSLGEKSCDGGSYHSFPVEMHNQTNFGDKINPDLGKHLTSDHECDSSPSETDKPSRRRGRNLIKDGARRRYSPHRTDDKLLNDLAYWELLPGRAYDPKRREVYYVCVNNCDRCNEYGCRELLKIIGCEKRFVCCSIERPRVFYAKLNKKEAAKLKGVKGIFIVTMYKSLWKPC